MGNGKTSASASPSHAVDAACVGAGIGLQAVVNRQHRDATARQDRASCTSTYLHEQHSTTLLHLASLF